MRRVRVSTFSAGRASGGFAALSQGNKLRDSHGEFVETSQTTLETDAGRPAATLDSGSGGPTDQALSPTPTIADNYADLLRPLNNQQRRAMILRLTYGFYEGCDPAESRWPIWSPWN